MDFERYTDLCCKRNSWVFSLHPPLYARVLKHWKLALLFSALTQLIYQIITENWYAIIFVTAKSFIGWNIASCFTTHSIFSVCQSFTLKRKGERIIFNAVNKKRILIFTWQTLHRCSRWPVLKSWLTSFGHVLASQVKQEISLTA